MNNNATLGQIKQYCTENGINIEPKQNAKPAVINNNQMYGDNLAQAYLEYYLMNKDDIDAWVEEQTKENRQSRTR